MKYLFINSAFFDLGGFAMVKGAINGILQYDVNAQFRGCVHPRNWDKNNPYCYYTFPQDIDKAIQWADVILDCGGRCIEDKKRRLYKKKINYYKKPLVWMCQSFVKDRVSKELLKDTYVVARGERSARFIKNIYNRDIPIGTDLSFLINPNYDIKLNKEYNRIYTTHIGKDLTEIKRTCKEKPSLQLIWKRPRDNKIFEELLPIKTYFSNVENYFGIISKDYVEEVWSARYQCACAGIMFNKDVKVFGNYPPKYNDLLDLKGTSIEELQELALISCKLAVDVGKEYLKK